jgi:2-polyprenyl-3-methyl-5-hydroxy-6-metoxy-1,4-benzoquinol methylase
LQVDEQLIQEVQSRYGAGPNYIRAYLAYWQRERGQSFRALQEILDLPPPEPMWFDYALSANWRGQQLYELVEPYLLHKPQRYLDVGCGFGGCLVAFGRQGVEVCGIDIDQQRIEFAKANCEDSHIDTRVFQLSILGKRMKEVLGTFDVITCMDVIEHVLDVPKALKNMAKLLKPGGLLVLEIPNKDSLSFVASDGHFNLFCITLLEREDAMEYHSKFFSFAYDIGYYYPLNVYEARLRKLGLEPKIPSSPFHPMRDIKEADQMVSGAIRGYMKFLIENSSKLPKRLNERVQQAFLGYINQLLSNFSKISEGTSSVEAFRRKYLTDFWTLIAYKQ